MSNENWTNRALWILCDLVCLAFATFFFVSLVLTVFTGAVHVGLAQRSGDPAFNDNLIVYWTHLILYLGGLLSFGYGTWPHLRGALKNVFFGRRRR